MDTNQKLNRVSIAFIVTEDKYIKIKGLIPTPSFINTLHSLSNKRFELVYLIDGFIDKPNSLLWLSDIKLGIESKLKDISFSNEVYLNINTVSYSIIYSLKELSSHFESKKNTYPNIYYPHTKKSLYQHLCYYATRLVYFKILTKEALLSGAIKMNSKLEDKYSYKELLKKVESAYIFISKNQDNLKKRLTDKEREEAYIKRDKKRVSNTVNKIKVTLNKNIQHYIKANGKINKSKLAKDIGVRRETVNKYQSVIKEYEK